MDPQAKQHKRTAVGSLRVLALELGLNISRRKADLTKDDFIQRRDKSSSETGEGRGTCTGHVHDLVFLHNPLPPLES